MLVGDDLVVTDIGSEDLIGLDPETGDDRWRRAAAAEDAPPLLDVELASGPQVVAGDIRAAGDGPPWTLSWPGDTVVVVTRSGGDGYAYLTTPGADGSEGGAIVKFDVDDGTVQWRIALPDSVAVGSGTPAIGASSDAVVVAGGERVAALAASNGEIRWSKSIASLGKSRGYVLPGSVQQVIVTDAMVFLLATPQS